MFDIGFPELILISIVALLVIGPDKLPETIRTISLWVGRFRRGFTNLKQEIENEIGADEIRTQLYNESIMADIEKSKQAISGVKDEINESLSGVNESLSGVNESLSGVNNSLSGVEKNLTVSDTNDPSNHSPAETEPKPAIAPAEANNNSNV